jgi:hypothetical protein
MALFELLCDLTFSEYNFLSMFQTKHSKIEYQGQNLDCRSNQELANDVAGIPSSVRGTYHRAPAH